MEDEPMRDFDFWVNKINQSKKVDFSTLKKMIHDLRPDLDVVKAGNHPTSWKHIITTDNTIVLKDKKVFPLAKEFLNFVTNPKEPSVKEKSPFTIRISHPFDFIKREKKLAEEKINTIIKDLEKRTGGRVLINRTVSGVSLEIHINL